jgi:hypothetical protein
MLWQGMPGIERKILRQRIAFCRREDLLWYRDRRNLMKPGLGFRPFHLCVFDAHCIRSSRLDYKIESSFTRLQLVNHCLAQKVWVGVIRKLHCYRANWHGGKLDRLFVRRIAKPVRHCRPISNCQGIADFGRLHL